MIAIIGAGFTGLSAAYHLAERGLKCVIYEKAATPGGLCRSYKKLSHTFDYAGHFLHLRAEESRNLVEKILPNGFALHERNAAIITGGVRVPYPFQAHLGFLGAEEAAGCLADYVQALIKGRGDKEKTFGRWLVANFGEGMYKRFFKPYNEKFWKCNLEEILINWTDWSIPRPKVDEVVRGVLKLENIGMGYNPMFLYPKEGGIGTLAAALAKKVGSALKNGVGIKEIKAKEKKLLLSNGEEVKYDALINTAPLPALFSMIEDAPVALKRAAQRLKWVAVDCVQLGFKREDVIREDWIYIPDEKFPFYRVGKYPGSASDCGTAMFVEFTRRHADPMPEPKALINTAIKGLNELGIITGKEKPDFSEVVNLDPAYVLYDKHRSLFVPRAHVYLERVGILYVGRYGGWKYSTMEDALLEGKRAAEKIN